MFHSGHESLATLANLIRAFRRRSNSFLTAAIQTDLELYESSLDENGKPPAASKPNPEIVEESSDVALLKTLVEQMQALIQLTAGKKKPKVKQLPRPLDAAALYDKKLAVDEFNFFENALVFVSQEELSQLAETGHAPISIRK